MLINTTGQKIRYLRFDSWWSLFNWCIFWSFFGGTMKSLKLLKCLIMYKVGINSTWAIRRQILFIKRKCNMFSEDWEIPGDALPKNQIISKHSEPLWNIQHISFHSFFFFLHQTWNSGLCILEFSDQKALGSLVSCYLHSAGTLRQLTSSMSFKLHIVQ